MTGDGAVVRGDHRWAKAWSDNMARRDNAALASSINVARAYLEQIELIEALRSDLNVATINVHGFTRKYHEEQAHALAQAAEIERLTRERDHWIAADEDRGRQLIAEMERRVDAEAHTTDLLKALEGMMHEWDKFTRYGSPMAKAANERVNAARTAIAAAKGGTV